MRLLSLPLEIGREEDGWWVVSDARTLVYGDGPTLPRALYDYLVSLRDVWQIRRAARRRRL